MSENLEQPVVTPNAWVPSVAVRRWIYGIAIAALALAAYLKYVPEESVPLWTQLLESLLGLGGLSLALRNVPKG